MPHADDSEQKRRDADAETRDLAARLLAPLHARLETLRLAQPGAVQSTI
jgi:hypothetical protein